MVAKPPRSDVIYARELGSRRELDFQLSRTMLEEDLAPRILGNSGHGLRDCGAHFESVSKHNLAHPLTLPISPSSSLTSLSIPLSPHQFPLYPEAAASFSFSTTPASFRLEL
ncbi:Mediator of RNA polymerase II transcription subunit 16 [Fusarium oxysporum f. sp. albedinis]|nr:Mediator of RNA polymerase II transcription subunit 16 [Fusarium oxysporum f. sp. albedinis]